MSKVYLIEYLDWDDDYYTKIHSIYNTREYAERTLKGLTKHTELLHATVREMVVFIDPEPEIVDIPDLEWEELMLEYKHREYNQPIERNLNEINHILYSPVVKEEYEDGFKESKSGNKRSKKKDENKTNLNKFNEYVRYLRVFSTPSDFLKSEFWGTHLDDLLHRAEKFYSRVNFDALKEKDQQTFKQVEIEFLTTKDNIKKWRKLSQ